MNIKRSFRIFILGAPFYFQKEKMFEVVNNNSRLMALLILLFVFSIVFLLFWIFSPKLGVYQVVFLMFFTAVLFQRIQILKIGIRREDVNPRKQPGWQYKTSSHRLYNYLKGWLNTKKSNMGNEQKKNRNKPSKSENGIYLSENNDQKDSDSSENSSAKLEPSALHFLQKMKTKLLDLKQANLQYTSFLNYQSKIRSELMSLFENFKSEFLKYREESREMEDLFVDRDIVLDLYVNGLFDLEKALKSQFILQNVAIVPDFRSKTNSTAYTKNSLSNLKYLEVFLVIEGIFAVFTFLALVYNMRLGLKIFIQLFTVMNVIWAVICMFYAHSLEKSKIELDIPECKSKSADLREIKLYLSNNDELNVFDNPEKLKNKKDVVFINTNFKDGNARKLEDRENEIKEKNHSDNEDRKNSVTNENKENEENIKVINVIKGVDVIKDKSGTNVILSKTDTDNIKYKGIKKDAMNNENDMVLLKDSDEKGVSTYKNDMGAINDDNKDDDNKDDDKADDDNKDDDKKFYNKAKYIIADKDDKSARKEKKILKDDKAIKRSGSNKQNPTGNKNNDNKTELKFIEDRISQIQSSTNKKIEFIETFLKNLTTNSIQKKIAIFEDLLKKTKYLEIKNSRIEQMRNIIDRLKYKIETLDVSKIMDVYKKYIVLYDFLENESSELKFIVNTGKKGSSLCIIGLDKIKKNIDIYDELYFLLLIGGLVLGIWGCIA